MKIDKRLNLVIPLEDDAGKPIFVHSTPIAREVFETYFEVISRTFGFIYTHGLGTIAGPRVAALTLRKIAQDAGQWDNDGGVRDGLMVEIRRLTRLVVLTPAGWQTLPLEQALQQKYIDDDTAAEVENALVFFTVASWMHRKAELPAILTVTAGLWGARAESLNSTEFAASLKMSTETDNTGETPQVSRVPY